MERIVDEFTTIDKGFVNSKGERIEIHMTAGVNPVLAGLWYKAGYTKTKMNSFWNINVYVYTTDGICVGKYNPIVTPDKRRLNFEWMCEATMENAEKLIAECQRLSEE